MKSTDSSNSPYPTFSPELRAEVRKTLFGQSTLSRKVVLTPIPSIFRALSGSLSNAKGWWPVKQITQNTCAVLIPQSWGSVDAVACMTPLQQILFVGLAGSRTGHGVGELLEANTTWLDGKSYPCAPLGYVPATTVGYVRCLADAYRPPLPDFGHIGCVDMESALLNAVAYGVGAPFAALLLITDNINTAPFYTNEGATWPDKLPALVELVNRWSRTIPLDQTDLSGNCKKSGEQ